MKSMARGTKIQRSWSMHGRGFQLIFEMKLEERVGVRLWYDALPKILIPWTRGSHGAGMGPLSTLLRIMGIGLDSLEDLLNTTLTWIPVFHNDTHLVSRFFPCEVREEHTLLFTWRLLVALKVVTFWELRWANDYFHEFPICWCVLEHTAQKTLVTVN